jgi:uncharacterized repeat protein (TIGR03803 family)
VYFPWVHSWLGFLNDCRTHPPERHSRKSRLLLEQLEHRCLPAVATLASLMDSPGGRDPFGGLVADSSGNLFGTTAAGGTHGDGTVFELQRGSSVITTLASFNGLNGESPVSSLVLDSDGNLFGITAIGGPFGDGTLFELKQGGGQIITLASFNSMNGAYPGSIIDDTAGNLFGTTQAGGASGFGTVFELSQGSSAISTLGTFDGTVNASPNGVIEDSNGNLFGTTQAGDGNGTVFEVVHGSGAITTLSSFDYTNGSDPRGQLVDDGNGNLFGTTSHGGSAGDGTLFEIMNGRSAITAVVNFDGTNGAVPNGLSKDSAGHIFGVAGGGPGGVGIVFQFQPSTGTISTVATFAGIGGIQRVNVSQLVIDGAGNLFGTTGEGNGAEGVVFEVPCGNTTASAIAMFSGTTGYNPRGGLIEGAGGNLFATAFMGGEFDDGTVFEVPRGSGTATAIATFNGANGANPYGALTRDGAGDLFGITENGGSTYFYCVR